MTPRIHVEAPLGAGATLDLPPAQSRHVQVLRLQPSDALTLFNGTGGEWAARVVAMGRSVVTVQIEHHVDVNRGLARAITLAVGMPANERMDALVEKATELGVAAIQPLVCERSVLRLSGERAAKRQAHWQAIAVAASEQCGRTDVPAILAVQTLAEWLAALTVIPTNSVTTSGGDDVRPVTVARHAAQRVVDEVDAWRFVLSPAAPCGWNGEAFAGASTTPLVFLSGPEGGLSGTEAAHAERAGFRAVSIGKRVLRADTAPLAILAWFGFEPPPQSSVREP